MSNAETAIRQAEFLQALCSLLNKYQAEIQIDDSATSKYPHDNEPVIEIEACGTWIPFHDFGRRLTVDNCHVAIEATINQAVAIARPNLKPTETER